MCHLSAGSDQLRLLSLKDHPQSMFEVCSCVRASPAVGPPRTHTNRPLGASRRYTRRWGRFCAQSSPPGAEIGPLCSPISANKRPIWARIGPYSAWFRRVSAFNYQHNYFLSHISSQKNQILQQNSTTTNSSIQII